MKLLVVSAYFETHRGGIEIIAGSLAKEIAKARNDVTWIAADCDPVPQDDLCGRRVPLPVFNGTERLLGFPLPIPGPRALAIIRREVAACDAVMIHDALYPANIAAFLFARWMGKPVVLTQHIETVPYANPVLRMLMRGMNRIVTRRMLAAADQAVFMSGLTADKFSDVTYRRPPQFIFSGVDTDIFHPANDAAERDAIRRQFGIPHDRKVALFVGRFVEKKGLHVLRAAAQAGGDITWVFAGWGPMDPAAWNLPNVQVIPGGSQAELAPLYRAADVFVLPSVGEGFPLVLQEAAVCGLPAVCGAETARADARLAPMLYPVPVEGRAASDVAHDVLQAARRAMAEQPPMQAATRAAAVAGWYSWASAARRYLELNAGLMRVTRDKAPAAAHEIPAARADHPL